MLMNGKDPKNIAGLMGRDAMQPAAFGGVATVDPLERLNQKMAGRTMGGSVEGLAMKKPSLMNSFGKK